MTSDILTSKEKEKFWKIVHSSEFQQVKRELTKATNEAADKYFVFGVPSMVVFDNTCDSGQLYYGVDRLQVLAANYELPFEFNCKS